LLAQTRPRGRYERHVVAPAAARTTVEGLPAGDARLLANGARHFFKTAVQFCTMVMGAGLVSSVVTLTREH